MNYLSENYSRYGEIMLQHAAKMKGGTAGCAFLEYGFAGKIKKAAYKKAQKNDMRQVPARNCVCGAAREKKIVIFDSKMRAAFQQCKVMQQKRA